ncbi:amino acid adenylation domain-containing protein [Corallococcus macrosporus]|uniref:Amino acid adenylation domain-containing protein n=2 Tax=Corallococcus macrosporus TaxID=35 RepID=A0ABS3D5D4_9BACT|nr:non-ribosomal peptide synthetase [Corallococcus macrosporus]MBN8226873.1 amino acid adenylation domain-containing protein [Corallococcus macrosporus]
MAMTPEEKRAKLARLLAEKAGVARKAPASFSQERMWFLEQWSPGSALFNMPAVVRLTGALDPDALGRGLQVLVERHETLRTTLREREGQPVQVIAPSLVLKLEREDLRGVPEAEREAHAWRAVTRDAQRPFVLSEGPLARATLYALAEEEHLLLLNLHHAIADGWSMGVLVRELAAVYAAARAGTSARLEALPLQYADFAAWQRATLKGEALESQLSWWRGKLDPEARLELPADKARPATLGSAGARQFLTLPRELTQTLRDFSQRHGTTLFVVWVSAFLSLVYRYTGQEDVALGTLVSGRDRAELEGLVGLFINTLVLRTPLSGRLRFRELMARVGDTVSEAQAHQGVPFEKLVEALKPERSSSHLPLFQVMVIHQNAPGAVLQQEGLTLEVLPVTTDTTKHDLTLYATELPQGLRLSAEYSTDLFEAPTVARLLAHLRTVLVGALAAPDTALRDLPLLSEAERRQLLVDWHGARQVLPEPEDLASLIEAQVARTPDRVALAFGDATLTYAQLDARANQLAHRLRECGVGPESRVGVCLERSLELVVSLLAVLKAGGAYVPFDPGYPAQRLTWMFQDARPTVLLAQEHLVPGLPPHGARVVCVDAEAEALSQLPTHAPARQPLSDALAYIIFTSGSTGRPKGAMNAHRGVCNRLRWMQTEYRLDADDVVLQKTPFSFDVSVWEFFWPLMTGARLVVARPGGHQEPAYLARLIREAGVTTLHFVPSMLQVFLEEPEARGCASLRRVVCSGEALPLELKERCLQVLPHAGLHNLYGPTEAAVDVTYFACTPGDGRRSVPIGRAVANTSILILDPVFQPVPVGVAGELYIGGVQVGRGYQSRPDLTAERFVPDPFSALPGARLYRTGDVARWLPDGEVEYLSRADFQVKVRGLRIELGEIETALEQHPTVRQAVVLAREDVPGDKRLVAYVAGRAGQTLDVDGLKASLQARLPEYMVPTAFVVLDALPLSPNGKVDRKALPAPTLERAAQEARVPPQTPTEEVIAALFGELLGVADVGARDDLFRLGGNSLLATRVLARLRVRFGVELSLRVLFQHPTVRQLARCVDDARAGTVAPVERAAPARERHPVLPLTEDTAPEDTGGLPALAPAAPVLSAEERHRVLVTWNDTAKDFPRDACLHHLVEAQARRTPDAVAVVAGPVRLTYRELEQRAGRLARRLRALGVGPEVRVGLCVERNADMVVGMLGILKAGGAYVPLDPTYPRERLAFLLEDARGPALVAHAHLVPALPAHTCQVVCLEDDAEAPGQASPDASLTQAPLPENLAYLIYTSGSTGRPKGVAIPHRAAVAFLTWVHGLYSAEELQGVLACTSLNFDLSVFEVFAPLTRGGRVILARNALHLAELPQASEVTLVNTVPSAMAQLLRLGALPPSVRTINLAGEALPASLARQVFDTPTVQRLYNLYGPSEDTTYSTFARVRPGEVPPIGRPLSNTRAYVLDADLRPVPVGQPGALYLAGEGQSRGYLHRPDLTAERFLPEPFGPPGSRMYKTGDRVRYRPDGTLEYLGRDDFQVKVRGFRIELGEVEAAVQAVPGVREAVVLAREDVPGDKRLVAYVVARDGQTLDAAALKDGLRRTLPEYMVPTSFVVLDALPLNPNGKVDRKALPVPVLERASPRPYEAPQTPTQQLLAGLWRQVLGVERVGLTDHFFELGGHSLLATQVVSRLRASLRVELPLEAFFHAPTLQALAARVDAAREAGDASPAVPPLLPMPRTGRLPLSFAQQRLWLLDRLEPGSSAYTILAALRLTGPLHTRALVRSFHALHQRHESLRTVFREDAQGPLQVILPELPPALGFVDLGGVPEAERDREALALAAAQAEVPFDLARGPLVRGLLVRLGARHHLLVVTLHHIISDGWSSAVLTRELSSLYEAFSTDQPPVLAALPLQYVDYTLWQRAWLTEDVLASQLAYWRRQLAGAPAALELPTDHPRPDVQTFRGGRVPVRLGLPLSESVKALGHREGVTPFMVLLAGLQALLSRLSGQAEVVVGSPIAGRPAPELEDMLGCFVNTLALRTRVDAAEGFRALLARVRDVTLGAYAHQDAPFDRVVEAVRPAREPGRSPLFQVLFVLENAPVSQPMGPGLSLGFVDVERQSAKFDLTLALWEEPETGLTGVLEYNRDLFDPGTATRWAGQLRALLEQAVLTPDAPLSRLKPGIAPAELLVPLQPKGTRPPFFCVHAIGGTVWGYAELARQLGEDQPFHGLQAPGLESGQPTVDSLEDLAALYVEAMRTVRPHGPYRLGGWSMGALIAFEMARQLLRQGEQVERLVFIEPSPTSYARGQRVDDPTTQGQLFTVNLAHTTGLPETLPPDVPPGDSHRLLHYLLEAGQRTGVFGAEVGLAWLQRRQRVFNACLAALSGHVLEPLGVPVWLLRGTEANVDEGSDRTRGWAALTPDPRVVDVPGTHYSVLQSPQVEVLGRALARVLESPPEASSSPTEAGTERPPTAGPRP